MDHLLHPTGGSWSIAFLAHPSQLYRVSERFSDENVGDLEYSFARLHEIDNNFPELWRMPSKPPGQGAQDVGGTPGIAKGKDRTAILQQELAFQSATS